MKLFYLAVGMNVVSLSVYIWVLVSVRLKSGSLQDVLQQPMKLDKAQRPAAAMFKAYLKDFGKQYQGEELKRRFEIFKDSLKEMSRMNRDSGATFGLTKFSDMTREELPSGPRRSLAKCKPHRGHCGDGPFNSTIDYYYDKPIPDKFDWRDKHYVGLVLDQKRCNGCWAFGIVGAMESQVAIAKKVFGPRLSIQELLDCANYTNGCEGGNVYLALTWLCERRPQQRGVVTEAQHPLKLVTQHCVHDFRGEGRRVRQFWRMCNMKESDILRLVYFHGPVIVVVNADPWLGYIDGVIQEACERFPGTRDHVVQIVGYDKSPDNGDVPHYIVRNSWGEDFGLRGYVKLAIGGNVCGLADEVALLNVYA